MFGDNNCTKFRYVISLKSTAPWKRGGTKVLCDIATWCSLCGYFTFTTRCVITLLSYTSLMV
jgi:hypothetical protein